MQPHTPGPNGISSSGSPPLDALLQKRWLSSTEAASLVLDWARGNVKLPETSPLTEGLVALIDRAGRENVITLDEAREVRSAALKALERELTDSATILSFPGLTPPTGWAKVAFAAARIADGLERQPL